MSDLKIETVSYLDPNGNLSKTCKHKIATADLIRGYKTMVTARYFDERMITLQRQGTITFALGAFGEEAAIVGSAAALKLEDWLYPQYREGATMFWRGASIQDMLHHMFCNAKDRLHGRQMPNHFGSRELNIVTASSPIASQIPQVAGSAYAMKLDKKKSVAVAYFGEGATSEGDFHAGLNFAAVRKAPAIFFCRNNGYAISTTTEFQFVSDGIAPKGIGYGMRALRCDGNDYFAVHETMAKARKHCSAGKGPVLVEAMTYRMGAHSTSDDPSVYRTKDEEDQWRAKCPIKRLRLYLEKEQLWDEQQEEKLMQGLQGEIDEAIRVAKATPMPDVSTLIEDVYFEVPRHLKDQMAEVEQVYAGEDAYGHHEHDPSAQPHSTQGV